MDFSYILVKPDGIKFFDTIRNSLKANSINVKKVYCIQNFDQVAIELYLNPDAVLRGNAPIIIGINEVWKKQYGTTAYMFLVTSPEGAEKAFVERVCAWKKRFRKEHIQGAYVGVVTNVEEKTYTDYGVVFSKTFAEKRKLEGKEYCYELQLNAIHSPDDISALKQELRVLCKKGAFRNRISLESNISDWV